MNLKNGVFIALIYLTFLFYQINSIKFDQIIYSAEISCNSSKKFDCQINNTCIDTKYVCNGFKDCPDGKDEDDKLCSNVTCGKDHFKCDKYKCLTKDWLCDGETDCSDGSDEGEYCRNLNCTYDQFKCRSNGKCIPKTFLCDLELDCGPGDNSDEINCTYPACKEFEFRCENQKCISLELVCDSDFDCLDGSDEKNCSKTCTNGTNCFSTTTIEHLNKKIKENHNNKTINYCHKDEFLCKSGECINKLFQCDGKTDCLDNSDELNCTKIIKPNVTDEIDLECNLSSSRQCIDIKTNRSICLPIENFCDNHKHCLGGIDEGGLCDKDLCFNTNCQGGCHNTPKGPLCYCFEESTLSLDGNTCLKKNSICEFGTCSQLCVPLKNRHKCDCNEGYLLESDGFSCKSLDTTPAYIIFSNRHEIRSLDLHTLTMNRPLVSGLKNTIALDFFHSKDGDLIFFTDIVDDKVYKGSIIHGSLINIQVIVETGLNTVESLAVDWIGNNLYWVESMLDQIEVAKFDGSSRKTLISGIMESPRSLALDARYRVLFWTDWDLLQPRIESASMDGEDRVVIFKHDQF